MPDFIAKQSAKFDYAKGIYVDSRYIPDSLISALRRNIPFDIWWVSDAPGVTDGYRLGAKVRYSDFRSSRGTQYESWALMPDLSASFRVDGGIVDVPVLVLSDQEFSDRYSSMSSDLRAKFEASVDALFGVSIIASRRVAPPTDSTVLTAPEVAAAKAEVADLLTRSLSSGHIKYRREFAGRLSAIGCAILESLERKGHQFSLAFAMAELVDPLRRTSADKITSGKNPRNFRPLTLDTILARGFSDPAASVSGVEKTQNAEKVHQDIVRRIFLEVDSLHRFSLFDSEFMDVGIFLPTKLSAPIHVIEVKSITFENLEPQIEKGLVQLARSQFYFGSEGVSYHLVLQNVGLVAPDWLQSIAGRLGVSVHWIDLKMAGPAACPSLFGSL
jgi:hypothetical protein